MVRLTEWIWKLIPKTRWCISKWAICDFHRGDGWGARKSDNRWGAGTARRLKRDKIAKIARLSSCKNFVSEREKFIFDGETLCHDIYSAWPITTVSLATNTYCIMDGHSSCAPRTVGPRVKLSGACEQSHWWPARHTAGGHLLSVVQAATNTQVSEPSISQRSQIKEDTVEPSVPVGEFNLKAYAAITWHYDPACLGLEPRLAVARQRVPRRYRQRHWGSLSAAV